jgi:1,4-dihydroxy-2-naphthoate polyprenyltransferase
LTTVSTAHKQKRAFSLKLWFLEARPHYLLLPAVLILVGSGVAWYEAGIANIGYALIALVGLVLCHMSVNIINDYFDFKSGVDLKTIKSPFNGGSGMLPAGLLKPEQVWWYGLICFLIAVPIGVFFSIAQGWQLLPLLLIGGFCILFYTPIILKIHIPEWSPGVSLGVLPVLGAYFVQTGNYTLTAFVASIPSGLLVTNLLLLNEFPDAEADKIGEKKTLPITIGKKNAAIVYSVLTILVYVWIVGAVIAGQMPLFCLIALLTFPLAVKAIQGSFGHAEMGKILPAMANNVLTVLGTQALLGIGYILGRIV